MDTQQNNIINLADHLKENKSVVTFDPSEVGYFKIQDDKIMQKRIYSFIVDFSVIMLLNTAAHVSYSVFIKNYMFLLNLEQQNYLIMNNIAVQFSVFLLFYTTYFFYSMYILNGQTFGKLVFKLKTVRDDFIFEEEMMNYTPSAIQAWRRTFGYLACYLSFGTFFLFSFMSEDKRGVPDYLSQTRTVSEEWFNAMIAHKRTSQEEIKIDITSLDQAA